MTKKQVEKSDDFHWRAVKQIADDPSYPFTEASLRYWILNANKNGLRSAIRKIGKKLFINIKTLEAWIDQQEKNED